MQSWPSILLTAVLLGGPACSGAVSIKALPRPQKPTPPRPAKPARLVANCDDVGSFRALAVAGSTGPMRAIYERWQPPAPVASADRPAVLAIAHRYLLMCGLDQAIAVTRDLVRFKTVSAHASADRNPAFAEMARYLSDYARKAGLGFKVFGPNDAWEITLGHGARRLGYVTHADVVPAGPPGGDGLPPGWSRDPFSAEIVGDRLYGRGTEDDKGPIAATLVVMRLLSLFGLAPNTQVVSIIGTGEESDWKPMKRYVKQQVSPTHVLSLDANFPVVIAESGFVAWHLGMKRTIGSRSGMRIVDARGGQFLTQVPGEASMTLAPKHGGQRGLAKLHAKAQRAATAAARALGPGFRFEVQTTPKRVVVRAFGQAVHASVADEGHNALWLLADIAKRLKPSPNAIATMLTLIDARLTGDHFGTKLGLAHSHDLMGALLVTPTVFRVRKNKVELSINMRRPSGPTPEEFNALLDESLEALQQEVDPGLEEIRKRYVGNPAEADTDSQLVPTLLDIYRRHTGDKKAGPISIRGGTYARLFPGAVSFGPSMPGKPYRGHAPDEYIEIEVLDTLINVVFETILILSGPQ